MARVYRKTAGKEYHCGRCGKHITRGDEYQRAKFFRGRTLIRCADCQFRSSELTNNDKLARAYERAEASQDLADYLHSDSDATHEDAVDSIDSFIDETKDELETLGEEFEEAADNIEEGFGHETEQSNELREQGEAVVDWANQIDELESALVTYREAATTIKDHSEEAEDARDEMVQELENFAGNCPV